LFEGFVIIINFLRYYNEKMLAYYISSCYFFSSAADLQKCSEERKDFAFDIEVLWVFIKHTWDDPYLMCCYYSIKIQNIT